MAGLNTKVVRPQNKTVNRAGGVGYSLDAKQELVGILLTSLAEDTFYETADARSSRLFAVMEKVDPLFAAKAAVFARDVFGMRSVTQIAAVALAGAQFPEKRAFYRNVVVRPDDALNILAGYGVDKPLPNAMKRGLADALGGFSAKTLAKYKSTGREVNMYDAINLVHPKSAAANDFMRGNVKTADTWEVALSASQDKTQTWREQVLSNKLGIMALLRNLRNIVEACGEDIEVMEAVYRQLTNEKAILNSRLFPYRFLAAYYTFVSQPTSYGYGYRYAGRANEVAYAPQKLLSAINRAAEISLVNVPELTGSSAIILDVSGSMENVMSQKSVMRMIDAGAMLGAMLYKQNPDSELVQYADKGINLQINADMPLLDIAMKFASNPGIGHGTNVTAGIQALRRRHDRLIVVSDMQTWKDGGYWHRGDGAQGAWNEYNRKFSTNAYGYEVDLAGSGTTQFQNLNTREFYLPTLSDKALLVMKELEAGGKGLIGEIEKIVLK